MAKDGLMQLVQRALQDPDFLREALADPEVTLAANGIHLQPEELVAVKEFAARLTGQNPADMTAALVAAAGQRGAAL